MYKNFYPTLWMLIFITTVVLAVPLDLQKRQSDQRVAELETLLALRKYGAGSGFHKMGGRNSPGYGLIDFNYIGRRKKSTEFGTKKFMEDQQQRRLASSSSSSFWPSEFSSRSYNGISTMKSPEASFLLLRKVQ